MLEKNKFQVKLSPQQMKVGIKKCLKNAEELKKDAQILFEHKRYARAFFLGAIALEELGKIGVLASHLGSDFLNPKVVKNFWEGFVGHNVKMALNFWSEQSMDNKQFEKLLDNIELTKKIQNDKMRSLYVDFIDNGFNDPSQDKIFSKNFVKTLIGLLDAKINLERNRKYRNINKAPKRDLKILNEFQNLAESQKEFKTMINRKPIVDLLQKSATPIDWMSLCLHIWKKTKSISFSNIAFIYNYKEKFDVDFFSYELKGANIKFKRISSNQICIIINHDDFEATKIAQVESRFEIYNISAFSIWSKGIFIWRNYFSRKIDNRVKDIFTERMIKEFNTAELDKLVILEKTWQKEDVKSFLLLWVKLSNLRPVVINAYFQALIKLRLFLEKKENSLSDLFQCFHDAIACLVAEQLKEAGLNIDDRIVNLIKEYTNDNQEFVQEYLDLIYNYQNNQLNLDGVLKIKAIADFIFHKYLNNQPLPMNN